MPASPSAILGLDVGERRVGVAIAHRESRLPRPLTTLQRGQSFFDELQAVIEEHGATLLVVGLPRNLSGKVTAQTKLTQAFVEQLQGRIALPIEWQDEALTSKQAEAELTARGKVFAREDIDALAATYLLEDYLAAQPMETE